MCLVLIIPTLLLSFFLFFFSSFHFIPSTLCLRLLVSTGFFIYPYSHLPSFFFFPYFFSLVYFSLVSILLSIRSFIVRSLSLGVGVYYMGGAFFFFVFTAGISKGINIDRINQYSSSRTQILFRE